MANRVQRFRKIFAELRRTVGSVLASADLLRLANIILGKTKKEIAQEDARASRLPEPKDSRTIEYMAVDRAMSDGGWRVLDREVECFDASDDAQGDRARNEQLTSLLGHGWQQRSPPG